VGTRLALPLSYHVLETTWVSALVIILFFGVPDLGRDLEGYVLDLFGFPWAATRLAVIRDDTR
jgi:predicted secreted protein